MSTAPPRKHGRQDVMVPVCVAVALLVYLPLGFDGYLTRDLALYSYAGQRFAEGVPPYLGVTNRAGPLAHALPGVGAAAAGVLGVDDMLAMRALFLLFAVACVAACYLLGRDVFRSRLAGVGAAATLLCLPGFIIYAAYGPREKTPMVLFLLAALLAMTHRRWATAGFFIALATLCWQPVFLPAIAAAGTAVWLSQRRGRVPALLRVAVGGAVPTALIVGAYAAIGALDVLLDNFLLINAQYTQQTSLLNHPRAVAWTLWEGYGAPLVVLVAGLVALGVLGTRMLARPETRGAAFPMVAASCAALAVGLLFALEAFNGWPDAFFLIPLAGLGVGGTLVRLQARSPRAGLQAGVALCLVSLGLGLAFSVSHRNDRLDGQRADVAAVFDLLPADARVLAVEAPQPLVLAGKRNLTQYQLYGNGLIDYIDDTWPGGREGYARDTIAREPTVIALGGLDDPEWLTGQMGDYRRVGVSDGWAWYLREDVGAETLARARAALD